MYVCLTCGIPFCRTNDNPFRHRSKGSFSQIIMVIPGPHEPKNWDPYLSMLAEELATIWQQSLHVSNLFASVLVSKLKPPPRSKPFLRRFLSSFRKAYGSRSSVM